jgi:hypothetical protein
LGVSCKYSRTKKYINASLNPLSVPINEKKIVLIKIEDTEYVIEVESNEIISTSSPELYKTNIEYLQEILPQHIVRLKN